MAIAVKLSLKGTVGADKFDVAALEDEELTASRVSLVDYRATVLRFIGKVNTRRIVFGAALDLIVAKSNLTADDVVFSRLELHGVGILEARAASLGRNRVARDIRRSRRLSHRRRCHECACHGGDTQQARQSGAHPHLLLPHRAAPFIPMLRDVWHRLAPAVGMVPDRPPASVDMFIHGLFCCCAF